MSAARGLRLRDGLYSRTSKDKLPAAFPATRTDVDEVIGGADHGFLMFDDNESVAEIAEPLHHSDEFANIAGMQPDGWLVEDEQGAGEARPETGRQVDPLRLPPGQGSGGAVEIEVPEPDLLQIPEPVAYLLMQHGRRLVR